MSNITEQDWEPLILRKKKIKTTQDKQNALRNGNTEVKEKNTNKGEADLMRKLENDMENLKVETVNKSISKTIMETRQKLKLKQKDLATKINVQPQVIQQLENGKAKPDINILKKLERVLKCKLTGKGFTK
uniref:Helix-turn-helix n=1 Tax=Mimiviridae sp. ChoanoV1 TaxID=2596887 RepID=A0A5B8IG05_9VIRU|nr:helix-turn-helix [Mimiviridae sp. ChoanoV1]